MSVGRYVLAWLTSCSHLTLPIIKFITTPGSHVCQNMTLRSQFPSAMGSGDGSQVSKFVWEALSRRATLLVLSGLERNQICRTLMPALHSCAEEILTATFPTCLLI